MNLKKEFLQEQWNMFHVNWNSVIGGGSVLSNIWKYSIHANFLHSKYVSYSKTNYSLSHIILVCTVSSALSPIVVKTKMSTLCSQSSLF